MSRRTEQIAGIIRSVAAEEALTIPPDIASVVTVARVEVSQDLSYADVFITALSDAQRAVDVLCRKSGSIRRAVHARVKSLHRLPTIRFFVDAQSERLNALDALLRPLP